MPGPDVCTPVPLPHFAPMLAKPGGLPADEASYVYEFKWEGVRTLAYIDADRVEHAHDVSHQYLELAALAHPRAVLDGEIVAFDAGVDRISNYGSGASPLRIRPISPCVSARYRSCTCCSMFRSMAPG